MQIDTMFGIPIFVLDEDVELPESGNYYVVASNGVFLHKDNGLMNTTVKVDGPSPLNEYRGKTEINHSLAKLSPDLCFKVKTFFAEVVAKRRAESCVILFYNPELREYVIVVPQQAVSHSGVLYRRAGLTYMSELAGYVPVGTIHSHCDFAAFHSGTDRHDEEDWDGLHVTFGHNDKDIFTITASLVMNGKRNSIDPTTVLEGITLVDDDKYTLVDQPDDFVESAKTEVAGWLSQITSYSELQKLLAEEEEHEEGNQEG